MYCLQKLNSITITRSCIDAIQTQWFKHSDIITTHFIWLPKINPDHNEISSSSTFDQIKPFELTLHLSKSPAIVDDWEQSLIPIYLRPLFDSDCYLFLIILINLILIIEL